MVVGALQCGIEAACPHVLLDLAIPLAGNELLEPLGKAGKFGRREAGNNGFKFFNAHGNSLRVKLRCEKRRLPILRDARMRLTTQAQRLRSSLQRMVRRLWCGV
jgi:hypothetical protein